MGIDIYMRWKGQTEEDRQAQYTGFRVDMGHVGYLREAYHGGPYATKVLVHEAFDSKDGKATIRAEVLRNRLGAAMLAAIMRYRNQYREEVTTSDPPVKAFRDFVELAEKKEQETGEPVTIVASY